MLQVKIWAHGWLRPEICQPESGLQVTVAMFASVETEFVDIHESSMGASRNALFYS